MKKLLCLICIFAVLSAFASCADDKNETVSQIDNVTVADDKTTVENTTAEVVTKAVLAAESTDRCFYGQNTGTQKTFTGFEPLPAVDFKLSDPDNSRKLSDELISHSYGVAKDGKAHDISVNNQKFFDDGNFDAVCLDNKTSDKVLYLTFDCGYENGYTAKILDTLKDKNVKAAFFCTLPQVKEHPDLIARMIKEGHIVGNHSVTHPDFSSLTRAQMLEEIKGFDDYIREKFGYSSLYFRYPQGKYSENSLDLLNSLGYKCVFWSLAYADWDLENQKGASYALETVTSRLHPGAVMLLHSVSPDNANALPDIIDTARAQGYEFRSLDDM